MVRILFIEDSVDLLDDLLRQLEELKPEWALDQADSIDVAWEFLCKTEYDCIVLDIMLPTERQEISQLSEGICLAKWLREVQTDDLPSAPEGTPLTKNRRAPIICYTSRGTPGVEKEAQDLLSTPHFYVKGRLKNNPVVVARLIISVTEDAGTALEP